MYWGWAFAWDEATAKLGKGAARVFFGPLKSRLPRVDMSTVWVLTNDPSYTPDGRRKPPFAAAQLLERTSSFTSLLPVGDKFSAPPEWKPRPDCWRDFLMPWNIAKEFWRCMTNRRKNGLYTRLVLNRSTSLLRVMPAKADVPIFASKLVVPVVYINDLPVFLKEGSPFC